LPFVLLRYRASQDTPFDVSTCHMLECDVRNINEEGVSCDV
jgi:hypothetical protein